MARPLRIEYPGAVYHITARGNAREDIFLEESDRYRFLDTLSRVVVRYNWLCHAYCLLDNHYHLLIETPDPNLSLGMRQLNGIYTQSFNRDHRRVGHVFQGRFKSILVEKETYLLELCRYVVLNPVRAGLVTEPGAWPWSSYRATALGSAVPGFLTIDWVLGQFSSNRKKARAQYRRFVADGLTSRERKPWHELIGQIFLGSGEFVARMQELLGGRQEIREIPRAQRYPGRPPLARLFGDVAKDEKMRRNELICTAHIRHGYTLKNIADHLGIHYTTVSRALGRD